VTFPNNRRGARKLTIDGVYATNGIPIIQAAPSIDLAALASSLGSSVGSSRAHPAADLEVMQPGTAGVPRSN